MPTIAIFSGIIIQMFFEDHNPPHVHAIYGGAKALVRISDGAIIRGSLPRKQTNLVKSWVKLRHVELMENWRHAQIGAMRKRTVAASASQVPMIDVVSVKPLGGYRLRVAFSDGSAGVHDFSATAAREGEMVRPLKDPAFFARVFVELGALTWPNGFDLDPIALHERMMKAGELTRVAAE